MHKLSLDRLLRLLQWYHKKGVQIEKIIAGRIYLRSV